MSRLTGLLCTLLLAVAAAGCGSSSNSGAADESQGGMTTIKVGTISVVDVAPLYLGIKKGFFAQERLKLEPAPAQGGAALLPTVLKGDDQFGYANPVTLLQASQKALPVQVVASGMNAGKPGGARRTGRAFEAVMVKQGSPIRTAADLSGKTVAVNLINNIVDLTLKAAIDKNGGDASKVRLVELPVSEMLAALDQGRVDAIRVTEPFTTLAEQQGARSVLHPYSALDPGLQLGLYFSSTGFAKSNPDVVRRFTTAMDRSLRYAESHPDEVRSTVPTYTKITAQTAQRIALPYWTPDINRQSIQQIAKLMVTYGLTPSPPDVQKLLGPQQQ
jgi:NitT/TauT family transport system substrate-binding protein